MPSLWRQLFSFRYLAQNTQRGRDFVEDRQVRSQGEALDNKIRRAGLSNVSQLIAPSTALEIEEDSLDFILLAQTLHDYYNADPDDARTLLRTLHAALKPGGILGVSDHIGLALKSTVRPVNPASSPQSSRQTIGTASGGKHSEIEANAHQRCVTCD